MRQKGLHLLLCIFTVIMCGARTVSAQNNDANQTLLLENMSNESTSAQATENSQSAPTYFIGYFPEGCTLNNTGAGVRGTCTCIQDVNTNDIWLVAQQQPWSANNNWSISNAWASGLNDGKGTCGLTAGWSLPTQTQLATLAKYMGDQPKGARGTWLNNNGFVNAANYASYWGSDIGAPSESAWFMVMYDSSVYVDPKTMGNTGGWAAHAAE